MKLNFNFQLTNLNGAPLVQRVPDPTGAVEVDAEGVAKIDGNGNRVGPIIYGPENIILVAGVNKIMKDEETAISRARNVAAPINMQRFANLKAPCKEFGSCQNCNSPDTICNYFLKIRNSKPPKRIKVILINENLGF